MKNGIKYAKEIQNMLNEQCYYCALWHVRNGFDKPVNCGMIPDNVESGSKEFNVICDKCLDESLKWLNEEYEEPEHILTDKEKEIVRAMCDLANKCDRDVIYVSKFIDELKGVYIYCKFDNSDFIETPWLEKHMFKGMEHCKRYMPEELGLEKMNG